MQLYNGTISIQEYCIHVVGFETFDSCGNFLVSIKTINTKIQRIKTWNVLSFKNKAALKLQIAYHMKSTTALF